MGTAKEFNRVLRDELRIHAAWLPATNTFSIGDYGLMSGGVFVRMGNISEFGLAATTSTSNASTLDFKSAGTHVVRLAGGASVNVFPNQPVDAKMSISFERENSFCLRAELTLEAMDSVAAIARQLAETDGWRRRYRVVSGLYTSASSLLLSSKAAGTTFEVSGSADALKQFELAGANADIAYSSTSELGLEIVGGAGAVGLSLFRLRLFGSGVAALESAGHDEIVDDGDDWPVDDDDL